MWKYCVQSFKDTNRKQFTTAMGGGILKHRLCSIFQRYKSKAIHNKWDYEICPCLTVFNLSKIQIESNSQLSCASSISSSNCVQSFKDTNRKQFTTHYYKSKKEAKLCSIFQRYKSKAIHNLLLLLQYLLPTVFNLSKIQIESNSQLL